MMRLFSRLRGRVPDGFPPLAPDTPFSVIGDVHGRADLLDRLWPQLPEGPKVLVGDYIDRGEDSAKVLRRLFARQQATPESVMCLAGNHEDMLLDVLGDPVRKAPRWLPHGGLQTLASFGVAPPAGPTPTEADWIAMVEELRQAMGQDLVTWLTRLPTLWQSGNVAVVHAGADPALSLELQPRGALLWGHPDFARIDRIDGQWVVHGHTIVPAPRAGRGRISIDTGAFATGTLTAAVIAPGEVRFITA